ncbi:MAG: amidophosphoribosyltransferase, partial [Sinobacteraceae bacterium]|nr:amidophosphoribosyltransferase [Nevskiaceae bacterium]
ELVAHGHDDDDIGRIIGADRLIYQDLDDLRQAVAVDNPDLTRFDDSVFTGDYVTDDVNEDYLQQLELFRSDAAKGKHNHDDTSILELHNDP